MKPIAFLLASTALFATGGELDAQEGTAGKKTLVAYFSHSGNTRTVADLIQKHTGGDLFEIVPARPYPEQYRTLTEQAKKEIETGYRPELKQKPTDLGQYEVIFVGSPCWWGTIAPPVASFLAAYDLKGKTIVPFMTHEGSRMGHSETDIRKLSPGATVKAGLPIRGSAAASAEPEIVKWLKRSGLAR